MSDELYIAVRNWNKFQYYSQRRPAWIVNHVELLHDENYLKLAPGTRALLHGLWLEYCSSRARLTLDTRSLSRRLAMRVTRAQLDSLNHAGYIEYLHAPRMQDACPRARVIGEEKTEELEEQEQEQKPPRAVVRPQRENGNEAPPHDDTDEPFSSYGDPARDEAFMEPIGRVVDRIREELENSSNDLG